MGRSLCRAAVLLGLLLVAGGVEGHGGGAHKPRAEKTPTAESKLPPEPEKYKLFEQVEDGVRRQVHRMLHTVTTRHPLKLVLEVQVLLLGFDGAGGYGVSLDEVQLSTFLSKAYRAHQPFCMETGEPLEMTYDLTYQVSHGPTSLLRKLEDELREGLREVEPETSDALGKAYTVDGGLLEAPLGLALSQLRYAGDAQRPLLVFLNPDKRRLREDTKNDVIGRVTPTMELSPSQVEQFHGGFSYRYSYGGVAQSCSLVLSQRIAVVDLAAGPCVTGRLGADEEGGGSAALPDVRELVTFYRDATDGASGLRHHLMGSMSALVVSAVRHLFVPDVKNERVSHAARVLMPLIVLRNHQFFDPIHPGHPHALNLSTIRTAAEKLIQSKQTLAMPITTHELRDHERLALAVSRARTSVSKMVPGAHGRYELETRTVLDPEVLLNEMHAVADMLVQGFINLRDKYEDDGNPQADANATAAERARRRQGTRVVPVYVLSLVDQPYGMLFDGESFVAADRDLVVILQLVTPVQSDHDGSFAVNSPFMVEGAPVTMLPQATTRHVLAGMAHTLAGVASPTERFCPLKRRRIESFLWAAGAHPFGALGNMELFSDTFYDIAQRNFVLSQIDAAVKSARATLTDVDEFAKQYMERPYGGTVETVKGGGEEGWLDELYHDPLRKNPPFPAKVVQALELELLELEQVFVKLGRMLWKGQLDQAYDASHGVLQNAHRLADFARSELKHSKNTMRCCAVEHELPKRSMAVVYGVILVAGVGVYLAVLYLAQTATGNQYYARRSTF